MKTLSASILLGYISESSAMKLGEGFLETWTYRGIGDGDSALPERYSHDKGEDFFTNTQRFYDIHHLVNEDAYVDDAPEDYYDPTVEAWVAMQ